MNHRPLSSFVPFAAVAIFACGGFACGGEVGPQGDPQPSPAQSQSSSGGSGAGSSGASAKGNGACANVAGTWLIGQNDCASDDFVIAQDGCNVAVKWYSPFTGTVTGSALTFSEANDSSLVCTATVSGNSFSGSCKATKVDGGPYDCSFQAIFQGP